jgi:hypothetical protein
MLSCRSTRTRHAILCFMRDYPSPPLAHTYERHNRVVQKQEVRTEATRRGNHARSLFHQQYPVCQRRHLCSRPSCYCCKLYFDHHPVRASTGRSHGMLWIQWRLPRLLECVEGTVDHTTLKVLRKMSDQVRKDALAALTPQKHFDFNIFNSTTGFSASHVDSQGVQ